MENLVGDMHYHISLFCDLATLLEYSLSNKKIYSNALHRVNELKKRNERIMSYMNESKEKFPLLLESLGAGGSKVTFDSFFELMEKNKHIFRQICGDGGIPFKKIWFTPASTYRENLRRVRGLEKMMILFEGHMNKETMGLAGSEYIKHADFDGSINPSVVNSSIFSSMKKTIDSSRFQFKEWYLSEYPSSSW